MVAAAAPLDEIGQRRDVLGELGAGHLGDRAVAAERPLHQAVVIEHWHAVGGDPHIALQPGRAQLEGQFEAGEGVVRSMGAGPAVTEGYGVVEDAREGVAAPLNDAMTRFRTKVDVVDSPAMFNLSGSEIVFLLLLALIVLGPEKLPEAVRKFGKTYAEFKKMTTGFQTELKSALDEPMREMRETAEAIKQAASFDLDAEPEPEPELEPETQAVADTPIDESAPSVDAGNAPPRVAASEAVETPVVRAPGPNFASAAPRPREAVVESADTVDAVGETASE